VGTVFIGTPSHDVWSYPLTKASQQLAEAIHTTPDTTAAEPDVDDTQSILLADTSTHNLSQQHDELFAVEGSDSDEEVGVIHDRGERDQEDSDDENDNESEHDGDRRGLMGNAHARRSWIDLADPGENMVQNGVSRPGQGSLSAKAGIILVRRPCHHLVLGKLAASRSFCMRARVYITFSSSFRSFSSLA
jgi:hypothetical protein